MVLKVTIYSRRSKEFLNVKVNGTLNDLADFNIHDSISFENLTGKFTGVKRCQTSIIN